MEFTTRLLPVCKCLVQGTCCVRKLIYPILVTDAVRIRIPESLWCSAPCPTGQNALFAVGTSDGLYTVEGVGYRWTLSKKPFPNNVLTGRPVSNRHIGSSHAVVTSVEWLSSDVIACGLKDSAVFLHDLRSGGTATRLQHPHSVSKIRRVDSYRLVVAGQKSVCTTPFSPFCRLQREKS